jgi:hypothetical protein
MTKLRFSASSLACSTLLVAACGGDNLNDATQDLHRDASVSDASLADAAVEAGVSCSDGVKDGSETDVDCGGSCPDACVTGKTCTVAGDCTTDVCTAGVCAAPAASCSDGIKDNGESDVDCGGASCPTCADGKSCTAGTDCADGVCSADGGTAGTCAAPSCSDGVKNGNESDKDCGGSCTTKRAGGEACNTGSDCVTGTCDSDGSCATSSCTDGIKDGDETDTDCGGSCSTKCPGSDTCKLDGDCASDICTPGTLTCTTASCTDHVKNGNETDVDCDGGTCSACVVFEGCSAPTDCTTSVCTAGACGLVAGGTTTLDTVASQAVGTIATTALTLQNNAAFEVGDTILIHQTQGLTAGLYETNTVAAISATGVTVGTALAHSYAATGAQAIVIPSIASLDIPVGATVTAPAWNGITGGILAAKISGALTIEGTVTMDGNGYRGQNDSGNCTAFGIIPRNTSATACNYNDGFYGESWLAVRASSTLVIGTTQYGSANASGGGGGTRGQDCAAGGGGGYGTAGGAGSGGSYSANAKCEQGRSNPLTNSGPAGGLGGATAGAADLGTSILLGGAGGEGGPDEDGSWPGAGGNGGGAIFLTSGSLTIAAGSKVSAAGLAGGAGTQTSCASSGGSGMGNGGGGAGGAIRLVSSAAASVGPGVVTALGGAGSASITTGCGTAVAPLAGGAGGVGRIQVTGTTVTGTTNPAAD